MLFRRKKPLWSEGAEPMPETAPVGSTREKLSWFEKRDRRRQRRKRFEEILGWILVPAFIYLGYLAFQAVGGVPKEIVDFVNELIGIAMRGA